MMKRFASIAAIAFCSLQAAAQEAGSLRIATYNLLNYPGTTAAERAPWFRIIMRTMKPDVMVCQEVQSAAGVGQFLTDVLNQTRPGAYAAAPFNDGPDTDNAFFYDSTKATFAGASYIPTALRSIAEYRFIPRGGTDTVRIFAMHLKASQGDTAARAVEVRLLAARIDALPPGSRYIVAGDYNTYSSSEPAYQLLVGPTDGGAPRSIDPLNAPGAWSRNTAFAGIHTQSPRVRQFEGGTPGGMDDRFDIILVSAALSAAVVPGTYTAYGNDGHHYNDSINHLPNMVVPDSVANAIHYASDHLPVFVDLHFAVASAREARSDMPALSVVPQPANDAITFNLTLPTDAAVRLRLLDGLGNEVAVPVNEHAAAGAHHYRLGTNALPAGAYLYELRVGGWVRGGKILIAH